MVQRQRNAKKLILADGGLVVVLSPLAAVFLREGVAAPGLPGLDKQGASRIRIEREWAIKTLGNGSLEGGGGENCEHCWVEL